MPPPGNTSFPPIELRLTMRPARVRRIAGRTSWVSRMRPKTLVSNCARTRSIGIVSTAPDWLYPALLTSAPTEPCSCSMTPTAARIDASSVTSSASVRQPTRARSVNVSGRRAVAYTVQPAAASRTAVAAPIPDEQPVMSTGPMEGRSDIDVLRHAHEVARLRDVALHVGRRAENSVPQLLVQRDEFEAEIHDLDVDDAYACPAQCRFAGGDQRAADAMAAHVLLDREHAHV